MSFSPCTLDRIPYVALILSRLCSMQTRAWLVSTALSHLPFPTRKFLQVKGRQRGFNRLQAFDRSVSITIHLEDKHAKHYIRASYLSSYLRPFLNKILLKPHKQPQLPPTLTPELTMLSFSRLFELLLSPIHSGSRLPTPFGSPLSPYGSILSSPSKSQSRSNTSPFMDLPMVHFLAARSPIRGLGLSMPSA